MKLRIKEGKFDEVKSKGEEDSGYLSDNPELEAEGSDGKSAGKVQQKKGRVFGEGGGYWWRSRRRM